MAWWQFWFKKPKSETKRTYGLVRQTIPGYLFYAAGYLQGFPFRYEIAATSIARSKPAEDTTVNYQQIISEILRWERRQSHKNAIYALYHYRPPNFVIRFTAYSSSGRAIALLEEALYISVPTRDTPTLVRKLCEAIQFLAEGMDEGTRELGEQERMTIRESLLYASPRTKQFWITTTVNAYVGIITRN